MLGVCQQHCIMCGKKDETRDQIFLHVHGMAGSYFKLLGVTVNPDWTDTLNALQHMRLTQVNSILVQMIFETTIYHL